MLVISSNIICILSTFFKMELIVNEVELKKKRREEEKKEKLKKEGKTESNEPTKEKEKQPVVVCRTTTDIQKRKLDKLMSNMVSRLFDISFKTFLVMLSP